MFKVFGNEVMWACIQNFPGILHNGPLVARQLPWLPDAAVSIGRVGQAVGMASLGLYVVLSQQFAVGSLVLCAVSGTPRHLHPEQNR